MKSSPLHLDKALFTKVIIEAERDPVKDCSFEVEAQPEMKMREDKRKWAGLLKVWIKPPQGQKHSYGINVEMVGLFSVDATWPEDQIEKLVYINGSGLLYSAIREMVCNVTARSPWGMLMLPTVSFNQLYNDKAAEKVAGKTPDEIVEKGGSEGTKKTGHSAKRKP